MISSRRNSEGGFVPWTWDSHISTERTKEEGNGPVADEMNRRRNRIERRERVESLQPAFNVTHRSSERNLRH
jgi:hypothetical protein